MDPNVADQQLRAIWSFWSKPYRGDRFTWTSELHHWLAWALSVETAKQHYPDTYLYTDDDGAEMLTGRLGLPFAHVSTALNALTDCDPNWWALGKLYTYSLQSKPFVHIDADVFLWKPLPSRLACAAVFAQFPEPFIPGKSSYQPEQLERVLRGYPQTWLPDEWSWYRRAADAQRGECCGILGGTNTCFIRHYANQALQLITEPFNQPGLHRLDDKRRHMILAEQYLLAACIEYHRRRAGSQHGGVDIAYLFESSAAAWNRDRLMQAGFTHLIADAKRNPVFARRLEARVQRDYPEHYARCVLEQRSFARTTLPS